MADAKKLKFFREPPIWHFKKVSKPKKNKSHTEPLRHPIFIQNPFLLCLQKKTRSRNLKNDRVAAVLS